MNPTRRERRGGIALTALITGAVLIGLAPIFVRLSDVEPIACAFWRLVLAWPMLLLIGHMLPAPQIATPGGGYRLLALAGTCFALDLALWHESIRLTSVANATLLANLAPVFVALAARLFWGERVSMRFAAGLLLAWSGASILLGNSLSLGPQTVRGDALSILASVFYAAYLMTIARLRQRQGTLRVMQWTSAAAALVLLPMALLLESHWLPQTLSGWAVVFGLAFLSQVCGQGLIAYALAYLPASLSATSLLVQPVAAAVFAWLLLAEAFGLQQAVGGVIVLAGIVICRLATPART